MHYIKPKEQREQMLKEKQVASLSLMTACLCTVIPGILILLIIARGPIEEPKSTWQLVGVNQTCPPAENPGSGPPPVESGSILDDGIFKEKCQEECAKWETCNFFEWNKQWDDYENFPGYFMSWCNLREFCDEQERSNMTTKMPAAHTTEIWRRIFPKTEQ